MVCFTTSIDELTNEIKIHAIEQDVIVGHLSAFHFIGLVSLEVNEKHRNRGIGSMIMKEYIGLLKQNNIKKCTFTTSQENIPMMKIANKFGFVAEVDDEDDEHYFGNVVCTLGLE
jgi:RimJ/RimL family protein N-acetyltransferase